MSKIVNRIAAVAALALAATPIVGLSVAHAAPVAPHASPAPVIARVAYGDLTLSHADGAQEFHRRVDHAAAEACTARKVRGLVYRGCVMDIRADLMGSLPTAQRAALLTANKAAATTVAER